MQTSELLQSYLVDTNTWDEMYKDSSVREQYKKVLTFLQQLSIEELNQKEDLAKKLFMSQGITFTVYSSGEGIEKIFPGMYCSVLTLDEDGISVRHLSAPGLPAIYAHAIDGLPIGPEAGSCGTAMYRKEKVIVSDPYYCTNR